MLILNKKNKRSLYGAIASCHSDAAEHKKLKIQEYAESAFFTIIFSIVNELLQKILPSTNKEFTQSLLVFLGYFLIAKISLYIFYTFNTSPALIWPVVGFSIAVVVLLGYKLYVPIFLAQFLALSTQTPGIEQLSFVIAAGYALQAVVAFFTLKKLGFYPELEKVSNVIKILVIAFIVTMIEPTVATIYQIYIGGLDLTPFANWGRALGGGIFSVLVFTPAIFFWHKLRPSYISTLLTKEKIELLALCTLLILANYIVFWRDFSEFLGVTIIFMVPAVFIWIALRFHPRWLSFAIVLTALQSLAGAIIVHPSPTPLSEQLLAIQVYVGLVAAIFYVFAAVVDERRVAFKKLKEAYELAATANKSKSDFIAILAHELRNPLAPVVTSLELLKSQQTSPESIEVIKAAEENAHMMRRLLDDLLDMARLVQNKIVLHKESISATELVQNSLSSVNEKAESIGHTIEIHYPQDDFMVYVDEVRIKQIIINLLNNALKYSEFEAKIELRLYKKNSQLTIEVSDSGIGIDPEKIEHIFDPFTQLGKSTQYSSGMGIGLFLTKQLTELHGGKIEAKSGGHKKGSTFIVSIPIPAEMPEPTHPTQEQTVVPPTKILVVDDNEAAANILQKLLKIHGHNVEVAYSGQQTLSLVFTFLPDVLFLDIGMPVINGYEVAKTLRTKGWEGAIVALSGYGQESDKIKSTEAGFNYHLVKPVGIAEISAILSKINADRKAFTRV